MSRRRSTLTVSGTRDRETTSLIEELRALGDDDLAGRLWRCRENRIEKSELQRTGFATTWARRCRSPACPSCRQWLAVDWRRRAAGLFEDAEPEDCSKVTIFAEGVGDLAYVRDVIADLRVDLRNLRDRRAAGSRRWASVSMVGHVECDAVEVEDVERLPPERQQMVAALPRRGGGRVLWLPHAHLAIQHAGLDRAELRRVVEAQWPGPHRVDVKEFREEDEAVTSAANIVAYGMKHEMKTKFAVRLLNARGEEFDDLVEEAWPVSRRAEYWSWLHSLRDGLRPLRIHVAPRGLRRRDPRPVPVQDHDIVPLPVLVG